MKNSYQHFDNLRDAKATLAQQIGAIEIVFEKSREEHSVYSVRSAGTLAIAGKLFEGPDCILYAPAFR